MINRFIETELEYTRRFSECIENEETIRFYDHSIPGMYTHNYIYIKKLISKEAFRRIIHEGIGDRRRENAGFLRVEFDFPLREDLMEVLPTTPQISKFNYMYIDPQMRNFLSGNVDCEIRKAATDSILKDGIQVDIQANQGDIGIDFAKKRIKRKAEVYQQKDSNLDLYVCYHHNTPIGNCEFLVADDIAKIEDFDIIKNFQRQGYGTAVIKHLLEEADLSNVKLVYLITGSEDTAKEMYKKCGFTKVGEKTELFFDLG